MDPFADEELVWCALAFRKDFILYLLIGRTSALAAGVVRWGSTPGVAWLHTGSCVKEAFKLMRSGVGLRSRSWRGRAADAYDIALFSDNTDAGTLMNRPGNTLWPLLMEKLGPEYKKRAPFRTFELRDFHAAHECFLKHVAAKARVQPDKTSTELLQYCRSDTRQGGQEGVSCTFLELSVAEPLPPFQPSTPGKGAKASSVSSSSPSSSSGSGGSTTRGRKKGTARISTNGGKPDLAEGAKKRKRKKKGKGTRGSRSVSTTTQGKAETEESVHEGEVTPGGPDEGGHEETRGGPDEDECEVTQGEPTEKESEVTAGGFNEGDYELTRGNTTDDEGGEDAADEGDNSEEQLEDTPDDVDAEASDDDAGDEDYKAGGDENEE